MCAVIHERCENLTYLDKDFYGKIDDSKITQFGIWGSAPILCHVRRIGKTSKKNRFFYSDRWNNNEEIKQWMNDAKNRFEIEMTEFELALINEMGTTKVWMRCENETYDMMEMED